MAVYILPVAKDGSIGGVKIGDYIAVTEDGTISIDAEAIESEIRASIETVKAGKRALAEAITSRGIETSPDYSLQTMANNISKIPSDSVTNMKLV